MPLNPSDDNNGRVTMAVLGYKMDNVTKLLEAHIELDRESREKHEARILANTVGRARLGERMNWIAGALVGLQLIGSTIAAFLGVR